jgi:hypothetical protein
MTDNNELKERYSKLSDKELLEIIDNKFDYTEEAFQIAINILSQRNISTEVLKEYKEEQIESFIENIHLNLEELQILPKFLFFIFCIPFLTIPFRRNYDDDGFVLKSRQASYYSYFGFISIFPIAFLSDIFTFENLGSFIIWMFVFLFALFFDNFFNKKRLINRINRKMGNQHQNEEENES